MICSWWRVKFPLVFRYHGWLLIVGDTCPALFGMLCQSGKERCADTRQYLRLVEFYVSGSYPKPNS